MMGQKMGFYEDDLLDPFYDFCDKKRKEQGVKFRTLQRGKKRDRRALWDSRNGAKTRKHHPLKLTRKEQLARKLSVDLLSMEAAVERAIKQLKHQLTS